MKMCVNEMLIRPSNHTFTAQSIDKYDKQNNLNLKLVMFAMKRKVSTKVLSTRFIILIALREICATIILCFLAFLTKAPPPFPPPPPQTDRSEMERSYTVLMP